MEDEQIIPAQDSSFDEGKGKDPEGINKMLLGIIFVLVLVIIGGGAYFFGTKTPSETNTALPTPTSSLRTLGEQAPTPTEEPIPTSTDSGEIENTVSPIPTLKISPKPSITMDKQDLKLKPSATPTPTKTPLTTIAPLQF